MHPFMIYSNYNNSNKNNNNKDNNNNYHYYDDDDYDDDEMVIVANYIRWQSLNSMLMMYCSFPIFTTACPITQDD